MKRYLILFAFVLFSVAYAPSSNAEFFANSIPLPGTITVNSNGVNAIAVGTSTIYIGGSFTYAGPYSGNFVSISPSTGTATTSSYDKVHGIVNASIPDGRGGWYVIGGFIKVASSSRNDLAHILPDGTVDPNFNPSLDSESNALALSSDGSILYIGGFFSTVGSTTRNRLAAVNTSDGSVVASFNPNMSGGVTALALSSDNSILYAGGFFTTVGGVTYNRLAAINTADGTAISAFNPNLNSTVSALALSSDGSKLYAGGSFTTVGVTTRNRLAGITTSNGALISGFNPNMGSTVNALALSSDNTKIYAGGSFTTVGGATYNRLAAINTADGTAISAFNPNMDGTVTALKLSSDDSKVFAGGSFANMGSATSSGLAAIQTSDGTAVSGFSPNVVGNIMTISMSADGSAMGIGGTYVSVGGSVRNRLAAVDITGSTLSSFNPNLNNTVNALALSSDGSKLYVGGTFTAVGGTTRNRLAGITTSDGAVISGFNPNVGNTVNTLKLSSDDAKIYAGGLFTTVGVTTRNRLAGITTSNGALISGFNPNMNNTVNSLALSSDDAMIYAGGTFSTVGGVTYNRLAGINASNGTASSTFNPNMGNTVNSIALSSDNTKLYVGGTFTTVGGVTYNRLAGINTATGAAISTFNPNLNVNVNGIALSPDGSKLYAGGLFTTVGGATYNRLAGITTSNGAVISTFNPSMESTVNTLTISSDGKKLYAGGLFAYSDLNSAARNFAIFSGGGVTVSTTTAAATEGAAGDSYTVVLDAEPTANVTVTITPDPSNLSTSPSSLAFTASNWNIPQTVIITAISNNSIEGTHTASISHSISSSDSSYSGISVTPITITITDSTPHNPTVTASAAASTTESGTTLSGAITADGVASSTERGFVYGKTTSYGATSTQSGIFGIGSFTADIAGLSSGSLYHFQAYATNASGTAYSSDLTLTTVPAANQPQAYKTSSARRAANQEASVSTKILIVTQTPPAPNETASSPAGQDIASPKTPSAQAFARPLAYGKTGSDVKQLQQYLNAKGYALAASGPGSVGNETNFFGPRTQAALLKFQKANGISATGYFGPVTKAFVGNSR
ncbi:MAG: hypothetical protein JWO73_118 [Candidatus Taylorbacteria bacterium]|nr:hypothetical protein [Candidatus Taylorbacteria bacterium]